MFGMLALSGLVLTVLLSFAVFGVALFLIKGVLLLVLLPLRLVLGILLFPLRLAGGLLGLVLLPVFGILAVLAFGAAVLGGLFVLTLPLLPLAALVFVIWLLAKATRRPAALVR